MASLSSTVHKVNSTVCGIKDCKVWGITTKDEGSVLRLDSGRIVKKCTHKTVWCYLEEFTQIKNTVVGIMDGKVWGIAVKYEGREFCLDSGIYVDKRNYKKEWCYLGEFEKIKETRENRTRMCFEEVAEKNSLISYKINLQKPLERFNLYLLRIMKDGTFIREDEWEIHEVEEMVVSARGPEEAKAIAATCDDLRDTEYYWKEPRYILCELLGKSYKAETKIISVSRYDQNG
jgi:hypothetical protein